MSNSSFFYAHIFSLRVPLLYHNLPIMNTEQAYNQWAEQYDTNLNKTRDLEAIALREQLSAIQFENCLEIGCGTGKNSVWLKEKATRLTGVDFSAEMLAKATAKINDAHVEFKQADITLPWNFVNRKYNLVSFSLVLEHIEDLDFIFEQTTAALSNGGYVYVGELHPLKQYLGSKARFETANGAQVVVPCFTHHVSDFTNAANKHGLSLIAMHEYFDDNDRTGMPRLLTMLFKKL